MNESTPEVVAADMILNSEVEAVDRSARRLETASPGAGEGRIARRIVANRKGMTLVEIMIVLTILAGIMVAVGVVAFDQLDKANIKTTQVKLQKISSKVQEYYAFQSPSAMPDGMSDLTSPPGGEPPYLQETDTKDAWGRDISISVSGRSYTISSAGPDGAEGGKDDVILESNRD